MCWLVEIDPIFIAICFAFGFLIPIFSPYVYENNIGKQSKSFYKFFFTCSCRPGLAQRNSYGCMNGWADLCRVMGRAEHACSLFFCSLL